MMSCHAISGNAAKTYFEHDSDYYTQNRTSYDRWHGSLAETLDAKGELSKEQFDKLVAQIESAGRTRTGVDCSFSAPKSVSLAMAANEQTRLDMIAAHQAAVDKLARKIEMQYIGVKQKNGIPPLSRNMIAAEFVHTTARPTEANNFVPDLDLHSHLYIHNMTVYDGKIRAVDFKKLMDNQKELGLDYRRELAAELQARGYELELTDSRQGFFELKGFDRETIEKYSNREAEILRFEEAQDVSRSEAKIQSRTAKDRATKTFNEISRDVHDDLFNGKIRIRKREVIDHERDDQRGEEKVHDGIRQEQARIERDRSVRRDAEQRTGAKNPVSSAGQPDAASFGNAAGRGLDEFTGRPFLSDMPLFDMDSKGHGADLLVPNSKLSRLAELQTQRVRDHYMQRAAEIRRGREIDEIAERAIKKLAAEKYAFSVHEAQQRIIAEGLLQNVRKEEAEAALERARVVKLGKLDKDAARENREYTKEEIDRYNYVKAIKTKNGTWVPEKTKHPGSDVYLTTEKNLETEAAIKQRVIDGKGTITAKSMTQEEARAALVRVEADAKATGATDFSIQGGEQAAAVEHILCCQDQYVAVDGLAGTGKTTMMERLHWICQEQGIEIKGCCFTGKAADGLQADSGIDSTTIHSFLNKLERESGIKPPKNFEEPDAIRQEWDFSGVRAIEPGQREIWAVDEAGLVDNNLMYQLQTAAEARGAQLLLLGDPDQLPPVGCGEPMRDMEESGMATARLTAIRRQKDLELLQAVRESVQGDHCITFEILDEKGAYREIEKTAERRDAVKTEMTQDGIDSYKERLLLVGRNADRKIYNKLIRAEYVQRGELEQGRTIKITVSDADGKTHTETRQFAAKDRMIFLQNDKKLGVMNGTMATVEKIEGNVITAKTDAGKAVVFDVTQYNSIDHSYAVTDYKAQGMTVQKVVADMSTKGSPENRNKLYVDISRAKQEAIVYTDDKETLEKQTKDFAHKITGKDFTMKLEQMREQGGITNNDRYHAPARDLAAEMERALNQVQQHTIGRTLEPTPIIEERTTAQMNATRDLENQIFKAQMAHDSAVGKMPVGAGAARLGPRPTMQNALQPEHMPSLNMANMTAAAATIPIEATAKMLQATAQVASLVPVVGKVVAAPMQAAGKAMDVAAKAVKTGVKMTVKTAETAIDVTKKVMEIPKQGVDLAKRMAEAGRAAEERDRLPQPQPRQQMEHEQEYQRVYVPER